MDFRYPPEAEAFRAEVRAFLDCHVTAAYRREMKSRHVDAEGHGRGTKPFVEALRASGYLTMSWPKEYGGQARGIFEQAVFAEEMARAGASTWLVGHVGYAMVGPALMHFGTPAQKAEILPRIADGTMHFCQMFSEPEAGSDLANLSTRAIADGDDYVVTGDKMFITWARVATHGYLLARTDPASERHRGLSLFLLDMRAPGIEVRPLPLVSGSTHGLVHFQDVRIPRANLIGELHRGWYHAMATFAYERAGLEFLARTSADVERLLAYARKAKRGGTPVTTQPHIRKGLVEAYRDGRIARGLALKVIDLQDKGKLDGAEPSLANLWTRTAWGRIAETKAKVYGMYGQLAYRSPLDETEGDGIKTWWQLAGRHEGGTLHIQRNIVAQRALGLPR
jgi:alkylation response protein AidB-like acyl-CoA dehydrogenase